MTRPLPSTGSPSLPARPPDDLPTFDPSELLRFFRQNGGRIVRTVALFVVIGVVHALLTPSEFTSDVRYMPELKSRMGGGASQLSSLAGLAGINLDNVTGGDAEAVRPDLYPNILQSTPFLIHLMRQPVTDPATGKPVSVGAYLEEK
ncbi:MAG: hypothetical protein H7Y12_05275, partial [Sphingobacteriaceae bacterium]|nr:hypothetical protein [Cytophagaceae bacterium]